MIPYRIFASGLVLLTLSTTAQAQSPTAEELVAKNLAARGGVEKMAALKSLRFDGKLVFPGDFQLTYQETRARGTTADSVRIDAALQGLTIVQAYDGSSGWRINPFEGRKDAERMSGDEARSLADSARMDGPLLSARAEGSTLAYLGREDFDGTLAYKLKVSEKDGDEFVYLLDPDSLLEIKMIETRRLRGAPQVTEYELGDYEQVGGVYYPMSIESWAPGQSNQRQRVIIATAVANPPVSPALFAQPGGTVAAQGTAGTSGRADAAQYAAKPPTTATEPAKDGSSMPTPPKTER